MIDLPSNTTNLPDDEISLLDMLIVLLQRKKAILAATLAGGILSVGISLIMPNIYQANATLLPPQQHQPGMAAAMLAQLGGLAGPAGTAAGIKNPNDLYVAMLKSRTITDRLVARFDLKKVYGTGSQEIARGQLTASTEINSGKDGLIVIQFEDKNKELVAKLTNAYTEELLNLTKVLAVTEASQRRRFYEAQLHTTRDSLAKAEAGLKSSLDTRGVISVESQSQAVLETVAGLKAQISAKEIQLNSMQPFVTANHPDYKRAQEELSSLRRELFNLENGRGAGDVAAVKRSGLDNIQRLRDLKYYQALYELLTRQYELARLDEAKAPNIVQVLDAAVQPERKVKPKRSVIVLVGLLGSFSLACLWILMSETMRRAAVSPTSGAQVAQLRRLLRLRV